MKRYIVFKNDSSHGTMLLFEGFPYFVTSHSLDDGMGIEYFVSETGLKKDALRVVSHNEVIVPAKGLGVGSVAPYLYEIECEALK